MTTVRDLATARRDYASSHLDRPRWHEVTAVGVRCEVLEAGDGPPLVLVHGGMAHCTQWVPLMARLARDHRCYAVERPSNGASEELDLAALAVDRRAHVTALIGDLLDGIGLDRAPIVGNSLGGLYALGFATQHPERAAHVVMAGAPAAHDHPVPLPVRLIAGRFTGPLLATVMRRSKPKDVRRGEGQLLVAHPERLDDGYLEVGAATNRRNADIWPRYMRWAVQGDAIHPGMPWTDWAVEASEAGVPISFVWGDRDRFVPIEAGRRFAASIGARFVEVEDAGHLVWLDHPDITADAIRSVLRDPGAGATPTRQPPSA